MYTDALPKGKWSNGHCGISTFFVRVFLPKELDLFSGKTWKFPWSRMPYKSQSQCILLDQLLNF